MPKVMQQCKIANKLASWRNVYFVLLWLHQNAMHVRTSLRK